MANHHPTTWSEPVARSPISMPGRYFVVDGWEQCDLTSNAAMTLADESHRTKVVLRATRNHSVGEWLPPLRSSRYSGEILQVGSGPAEWYLIGAEPPELMVEGLPIEGGEGFASWVDVTHGRALMRVTGVDTDSMLSKLCAVNLAEGTTPNSAAFRTSIASVTTDIIRDDQDGLRSYLLHCERSSGRYLFEALLDAGTEFGCELGRRVATSSPVADRNMFTASEK